MLAQRSPVDGQGAGEAALAARRPRPASAAVDRAPPGPPPPPRHAKSGPRPPSALAPARLGVIRSRTGRASWCPGRDRASSGPVFPAAGGCSLGVAPAGTACYACAFSTPEWRGRAKGHNAERTIGWSTRGAGGGLIRLPPCLIVNFTSLLEIPRFVAIGVEEEPPDADCRPRPNAGRHGGAGAA